MLRTALKILLALSLLTQGGFSTFAGATDMHSHPHPHRTQHDDHGKMPCCPDSGTQSGTAACTACCTACIATEQSMPLLVEPMRAVALEIRAVFALGAPIPPNPPPIA